MFGRKPDNETELYKEVFALAQRQLELLEQSREKWPTVLMKARGARAELKIEEKIRKILILKLDAGCAESDVIKRFLDDVDIFVEDTNDWPEVRQPHKEYIQDVLTRIFG